MFSNPVTPSRNLDEGTILQVDPIRGFCKIRTLGGQILHSVQWLLPFGGSTRGADRFTPMIGDRVMVEFGLGYPVIIGFFSKLQTEDETTPIKLVTGSELVDTGNYSPEGKISWGDQNKPKDFVHGDKIVSSIGGNFLALLRGGSTIIRSSRASEILLSNFHNLVRIVSRNWEHFTDVCTDVVRNFKGKVYRYIGYAPTFAQAKTEDYKLHYYYGDTSAAEAIKTGYNTSTATPSTNTIIFKEQITDTPGPGPSPREIMRRTLKLDGEEEVYIYNGTHFTRVKSTAEQLTISWNDQNTITINETAIHAVHKDGADFIMNASGIKGTFSSGEVNLENNDVKVNFGNSHATLTNSQITLENGNGSAIISNTSTQIINSSHSVTVNASGVQVV